MDSRSLLLFMLFLFLSLTTMAQLHETRHVIKLKDGEKLKSLSLIEVDGEVLSAIVDVEDRVKLYLDNIHSISYRKKNQLAKSALVGTLIGIGVGLVKGYLPCRGGGFICPPQGKRLAVNGIFFGGLGLGVGFGIGFIKKRVVNKNQEQFNRIMRIKY